MIITPEQYSELLDILPNDAKFLVLAQDLNAILEALHVESVANFDENDEPTKESDRIEKLMDEIHWQNTHSRQIHQECEGVICSEN